MSHALSRGFMTASVSSTPDEARSARMIVKDLVNAKLLYCTPPPGLGAEDYAGRTERITDRKPLRNPTSQRYIAGVQAIFDAQKEVGPNPNPDPNPNPHPDPNPDPDPDQGVGGQEVHERRLHRTLPRAHSAPAQQHRGTVPSAARLQRLRLCRGLHRVVLQANP